LGDFFTIFPLFQAAKHKSSLGNQQAQPYAVLKDPGLNPHIASILVGLALAHTKKAKTRQFTEFRLQLSCSTNKAHSFVLF